jgi:hypothetical protein
MVDRRRFAPMIALTLTGILRFFWSGQYMILIHYIA